MRYIVLIIIAILVLVLFSIDDETISKKFKFLIVLIVSAIAAFGYFYEKKQKDSFENIDNLTKAFKQGKMLSCKKYDVDLTNFNFSYPTQSFIAKKDVKNKFKNVIVKVEDCKIKDE